MVDETEINRHVEVAKSLGLQRSLVLFWMKSWKHDHHVLTIDANKSRMIDCDEEDETKLLRYWTHFANSTITLNTDDDIHTGQIDRVFDRMVEELSPNISYYSEDEYPHKHFALSCGVLASFCFPFYHNAPGVMEIVSTRNQDVGALRAFSRCLEDRRYTGFNFRDVDWQPYANPVLGGLLESVCQRFHLPLAQYWTYSCGFYCLLHQFGDGDSENLSPWLQLKDVCLRKSSNCLLGTEYGSHVAFFCKNISALSITKHPLAHYARKCGSIACFTIYLLTSEEEEEKEDEEGLLYVLEFFLPSQETDNDYPKTLLNSIWTTVRESLPNIKLVAGEREKLGPVLSVEVINSSTQTEPESFEVGHPQTSIPHYEDSDFSHTLKLFGKGPGYRSDANSYEEAVTGKTSKRIPDEASQPRRSEEYFKTKGNTMAAERVDEVEEELPNNCNELQSLTSQLRRFREIFGDEGYTVASQRVDNLVEVSPDDEDVEYAMTTASKRLKKSKLPCTVENISKHFGRPLKDAAESFGLSVSTFKRRCRDVGISWWQPGKSNIIDGEPGEKNLSSGMSNFPKRHVDSHSSQDLKTITVKVTNNAVTIRFELPCSSGIAELENSVIERLHLDRKSFSLKYQDDEGDWISITCDKDVRECIKIIRSQKKPTIKMELGPPITTYST